MIERYVPIYDEGDWILDTETDEYLDTEEACQKLNQYEKNLGSIASFFGDISRRLDEVEKG